MEYNSDIGDVNDDNVGLVVMMVMMVLLMMMMVVVWLGGSWWTKRGNWKTKAGWPLPPPPLWSPEHTYGLQRRRESLITDTQRNWNRSLSSKLLNWDRSHSNVHNKHTTKRHFADRHGHKNIWQKHQI